jgi:hypothetical protein
MKRREFVEKLGIGSVALASGAASGLAVRAAVAQDKENGHNHGQLSGSHFVNDNMHGFVHVVGHDDDR